MFRSKFSKNVPTTAGAVDNTWLFSGKDPAKLGTYLLGQKELFQETGRIV